MSYAEKFNELMQRIAALGGLHQIGEYLWRNPKDVITIQRCASEAMMDGDTPESR